MPGGDDQRETGWLYPAARVVLSPLFKAAWRVKVSGREHVPTSGGAIMCPNHISVLDSFFLPLVLPRPIIFVGKAEYMDDWKTKHLFPALGMIPIVRGGGSSAQRALDTAAQVLDRGDLFGIYPEGTRSRDGLLHKGHTGAARLALRTGAPLVPVGFRGTREVMPAEAKVPRVFLPVEVHIGRPITIDRYRHRVDDRLVLRQLMDEVMYSIRDLSGQDYIDRYATKKAQSLPTDTARITGPNGHVDVTEKPRRSSAEVLGTSS